MKFRVRMSQRGAVAVMLVVTVLAVSFFFCGCVAGRAVGQPGVDQSYTPDPHPEIPGYNLDALRTYGVPPRIVGRGEPQVETTIGRLSAGTVFQAADRELYQVLLPSESFRENDANRPIFGGNQPPAAGGRVYVHSLRGHLLYLMDADDRALPVAFAQWVVRESPEQ